MSFGETLAAILVGAAAVLLILFLIKLLFKKKSLIKKEINVSSITVAQSLQNIGVLETAEYVFTNIDNIEKPLQIGGKSLSLGKSKVIYTYSGRVIAGIDLLEAEVHQTEEKIIVSLPKAYIRAVEIFEKEYKVYDEKNNLINPLNFIDFTGSRVKLQEKEKENACKFGLLEKADANAKTMLENMIKALPAAETKQIVFKETASLKAFADSEKLRLQ